MNKAKLAVMTALHRNGMSQYALAKAAGVSTSRLNKWLSYEGGNELFDKLMDVLELEIKPRRAAKKGSE